MKQPMSKQDIAQTLDQAAFSVTAIQQISIENEINLEDAYDIQAASIDKRKERGEKLTGFKLGFTSKAKMEQMGVHEIIWGRLTDLSVSSGDARRNRIVFPDPSTRRNVRRGHFESRQSLLLQIAWDSSVCAQFSGSPPNQPKRQE